MKGWPVALAASAAVGAGSAQAGCSSDSGGVECDCASATVIVQVPADRAPDAVGVTLSGRGCATAAAQCVQAAGPGCAQYAFEGTADGECTVDVQFAATPADFSEQVSFAQVETCCPAFYVQPPGASPIEVPEAPDAGEAADAGGAG